MKTHEIKTLSNNIDDNILKLIDLKTESDMEKVLNKMDAFNSKVESKMDAFNSKVESKMDAFNSKVESKIDTFNSKTESNMEHLEKGYAQQFKTMNWVVGLIGAAVTVLLAIIALKIK